MLKCAKLKIFGRVQGVFFRDYTQEKATELGLHGWVKNMPDGTVEALIQGAEPEIEKMIAWFHEGSPSSQVEKVDITWLEPADLAESFEISY